MMIQSVQSVTGRTRQMVLKNIFIYSQAFTLRQKHDQFSRVTMNKRKAVEKLFIHLGEHVQASKMRCLFNLPTTVGSKSTNTARGTCFPAPVSLKNVLKESSPPPIVLSLGIWPSGWIPCSRQYNSQQALPIWTPAWPTCTEIHSR